MVLFNNIRKLRFFLLVLMIAVLLLSCTDFFSNSWASWAARDPDKLVPTVTAGNVDELIAISENNTDLSLAVLKKIGNATKGASGDDLLKLQKAALGAATNAVGLTQAVLSTVKDLGNIDLTDPNETDQVKQIVLDAIGSMKNLDSTSTVLLAILPVPDDLNNPDSAFNEWARGAKADDLAMAAVVLIAGDVKDKNIETIEDIGDYIDGLNSGTSDNAEMALALALATTLNNRVDELSDSLKNVLNGLNLFPVV